MAAGFREGLVEGDGLPIRHMDAAEGPARNLCGGHRARYHPRPRATEPQVPGRRLRDAGLRRLGQEHAYARHGRARADDGCRRPSRSAPSRSGTESLETGYKTPVVPSVSSSGSAAAPVIPISSWATGNRLRRPGRLHRSPPPEQFVGDSPLEGDGFELLVPRHKSRGFPQHSGHLGVSAGLLNDTT
jgi:hypothetical protein